jgi:hypothetical protein
MITLLLDVASYEDYDLIQKLTLIITPDDLSPYTFLIFLTFLASPPKLLR